MGKVSLIIGLIVISSVDWGMAQPFQKEWDFTYGGTKDEIIESFFLNTDNGYIIGGSSLSGVTGDKTEPNWDPTLQSQDFWILRTDSNGMKMWDKRFGGTGNDMLTEVILTNNGLIVAGGQTFSGVGGNKSEPNWDLTQGTQDYWIIKFDQQGNKIWDKRFGGTFFELFESVKETADGGFLVGGSSLSGVNGDKTVTNWGGWDYWIVKIDSAGNKIWDNRYGGDGDDMFTDMVTTPDGGALLGGYTKSKFSGDHSLGNQGAFDYWVVRINSSGTLLWEKNYGGNYNDWLFSLSTTSTGGFLLGGQSFSEMTGDKSEPNHDAGPSGSDYWVIKLDSSGNKIWDRTIGATAVEALSYVYETDDLGYLLSGESYSGANGDKTEDNLGVEQTWVVKIDSSGTVLWDKTMFSLGHDEKGLAIPVNDLCFSVVNYTAADTGGYKSDFARGDGDYWFIKMCDITVGLNENISLSFSLYPNPANNYIVIKGLNSGQRPLYSIISIHGKVVKQGFLNAESIAVQDLPAGIYILRILEGNRNYSIKFIKSE
jgi:type IX secretion system substrate protein